MDTNDTNDITSMTPEYDYFSLSAQDRLPLVNEQIKSNETRLFNLQMEKLTLEGAPEQFGTISHEGFEGVIENAKIDAEKAGHKYVQQQLCPCSVCTLERINGLETETIFRLNKLQALASTLTGKKK